MNYVLDMMNAAKVHVSAIYGISVSLNDIVMNALTIANFLQDDEAITWLTKEYSGYSDPDDCPDYRNINCYEKKYTFENLPDFTLPIRKVVIHDSIAVLESHLAIASKSANGCAIYRLSDANLVFLSYIVLYGLFKTLRAKIQRFLFQVLEKLSEIERYNIHPDVWNATSSLLQNELYFHAANEAEKLYIKFIGKESGLLDDGDSLMNKSFGTDDPPLKINAGLTTSDENEQKGVMFLSKGINCLRNVTAHEPELDSPMRKDDAMSILSLISYLWRKVENRPIP